MTDAQRLTIALILCFIAVAVLAYEAGADARKRAEWCDECEAHARQRHPAGRDA